MLFVSVNRLTRYRNIKPALVQWAMDSGGFTEITQHGHYRQSPREYMQIVKRMCVDCGGLLWASQQDWMCESIALQSSGLTIRDHQRLTIENWVELQSLDPPCPVIPVLQGYSIADYLRHLDQWGAAGVDLTQLDRVGVGSVCRRQGTEEIAELFRELHRVGLTNLHGFGVKVGGLRLAARYLKSSDSLSWSKVAKERGILLPECRQRRDSTGHGHITCANCERWASRWYEDSVVQAIEQGLQEAGEIQLSLF
jgi:hypothetical protein